jgi:hypothetical protein
LTEVVDSTKPSEALGDDGMPEIWSTHNRVAGDLLPVKEIANNLLHQRTSFVGREREMGRGEGAGVQRPPGDTGSHAWPR